MMIVSDIYALFQASAGVSIDSRTVMPGQLFIAIRGDHFDGNAYAKQALEKGASYAIVDDPSVVVSDDYILVDSGLVLLQRLAKYHRQTLSTLTVMALAGSNGKTTSKALIHTVLSTQYSVLSTDGNLNNHIGVPLTLLRLTSEHEFAVIELGANHINEHAFLCDLVQPTHGVITNCGLDHLAGYGSIAGVIQGNGEVFDYLKETDGTAFVRSDDTTLMRLVPNTKTIYYGNNGACANNVSCAHMTTHPFLCVDVTMGDASVHRIPTHLFGAFNAHNILLAVSVGHHFNVPINHMISAISSYRPTNYRSQVCQWRGATVYLDAYNANPSSMAAFLTFVKTHPAPQKILVLGDMAELGDYSGTEHVALLQAVLAIPHDHLYLTGEAFNGLNQVVYANANAIQDALINTSLTNAAIFIKGSRRHALETIID
ncbi:MAG: UDP-N-acetylmuramoyl-tripeptide--D-alanyl-D-alanine ligase [Candidatus Marinamargulisbacteria bacterium]